ncbi:MAG: hypothetical protein ABSB37_01775, partial [Xanthobacteraceae bacterium]
QAMVGPNFKRMDRSPEKSASITVTIQPSRLADGEFFSSLLGPFQQGSTAVAVPCRVQQSASPPTKRPATMSRGVLSWLR